MIVGSTAAKYWFDDFPREPKDFDLIINQINISKQSLRTHKKVEELENPVLLDWFKTNFGTVPYYCTPSELYTLKISHLFWDLPNNSWDKHIYDVAFLKEKGCMFIPELFWKLFNYWETIHGKRKSSNLDMSADDFFNNRISYHTPHDKLHELLVTHPYFNGSEPTYKKILKDGAEVDVCMKKFEALTELEKFNVVFEEVAVMSMENRFPNKLYWKAKYSRMLKKFIISHCKVEEGIWIIQNHKNLLCNIPFNFHSFINEKSKY